MIHKIIKFLRLTNKIGHSNTEQNSGILKILIDLHLKYEFAFSR